MAQTDLEQIFRYISVDLCNPAAAAELIDDFQKAFDNICAFPESCPRTNNAYVKDASLRKSVVGNYIAFYKVAADEVQIVRVLYGMRNFEGLL